MFPVLVALVGWTQFGPAPLQPTKYESPSREWSVFVDPSFKSGAGPAEVTVSRGAELVWKAKLPFTFLEAAIDDSGRVGGYGFTDGTGLMFPKGEFVVALFGADGARLVEEREKRESSRFPHCSPNPWALGLLVQPLTDRFVVRVADEDVNVQNESWWCYRLSTGEKLERVHPKELIDPRQDLLETIDAQPIPSTPLTVVQWYELERRPNGSEPGTRFVLVDAEWKPVWTIALPREFARGNDEPATRTVGNLRRTTGILAAAESGRFELHHVANKERVTYEVTRDAAASSGWSVRELARGAYEQEVEETPELPVVALRKLGSTPLQLGAPNIASTARGTKAPESTVQVSFDDRGHVMLQDRHDHVLRFFSANGALAFTLTPDAVDHDRMRGPIESILTAPDGRVFLRWTALDDSFLAYGPECTREGWGELDGEQVVLLANGHRWAAASGRDQSSVRRLAPDGTILTKFSRRPDGGFFDEILALGCTPDGSLAVLSVDRELELALYSPTGQPVRALNLHGATRRLWHRLDYHGRWILISAYYDTALLVSLPDERVSLVRVTEGPENCIRAYSLSPDGTELWCATLEPPVLHRFELPPR